MTTHTTVHTGHSFFEELKKLITNIPDHTISLDIHIAVDEVVTMTVKAYAVTGGQYKLEGDKAATQETRYMIVPEGADYDADYEIVGYQFWHYGGWRSEQRWNDHTSTQQRAIYVRNPLPKPVEVTTVDSPVRQYVNADPKPIGPPLQELREGALSAKPVPAEDSNKHAERAPYGSGREG